MLWACKPKAWWIVPALALFVSVKAVGAQGIDSRDPAVTATFEREQPVEATPGQPLTLPLSVRADSAGQYTESIDPPARWRVITTDRTFELDARQPATRLLTLSIPHGTEAGSYRVVYRVRPKTREAAGDTLSIEIRIPERRAVSLRAVEPPTFVVSGDTLAVILEVRNAGNVPSTVRIRQSVDLGRLLGGNPVLKMEPGATERVEVRNVIPSGLRNQATQELRVGAFVDDNKIDSTRLSTPVFPELGARGGVRYHRYPITVTALAGGIRGTGESGLDYQFKASGSGTLREDSRTEYSFDVRVPGAEDSGFLLRRRNEFSAAVDHPNFRIELGDQGFRLSDLTRAQGQFGGSAEAMVRGFGTQIYAARSRFGGNSRHAGARLDAQWGDDNQNGVGINGVIRRGRIRGRMFSLNAHLSPLEDVELNLEHGFSGGRDGGSSATEASGGAQFEYVSLGGGYTRIGTSYPQFGAGRRFYSGFVDLLSPLFLSFRGRFSLSKFGGRHRARIRADLGVADWFNVGYRQDRVRDRTGPTRRRNGLFIRTSVGRPPIQFRGIAEVGRVTTPASNGHSPVDQRYRLRASLDVSEWLDIRLRGEYRNEVSLLSELRRHELSGRLGLDLRLASGTDGNLNVSVRKRAFGLLDADRLQIQGRARLTHKFESTGHLASVIGRYSSGTFGFLQSGLSVRYSVPFEVPTHRSQKTGTVRGQLVDESTGERIAGVPIRLGEKGVVTGQRGQFTFSGLQPGTYSITVEQQALGSNKILKRPPGSIVVTGGASTNLQLRVTTVGAVTGRVRIERREGIAADTGRIGGLANALVELSADGETRRQFTGQDGTFRFPNVSPGAYTVRLLPRYLPDQTRIETSRKTAEVSRGDTTRIGFMVRSRQREIQPLTPGNEQEEIAPVGPTEDTTGAGPFVVQLGVFPKRSNAEELVQEVRGDGYFVVIRSVRRDGTAVHKVWAGSYATRRAAEDKLDQFAQYAPDAVVVQPENPPNQDD